MNGFSDSLIPAAIIWGAFSTWPPVEQETDKALRASRVTRDCRDRQTKRTLSEHGLTSQGMEGSRRPWEAASQGPKASWRRGCLALSFRG